MLPRDPGQLFRIANIRSLFPLSSLRMQGALIVILRIIWACHAHALYWSIGPTISLLYTENPIRGDYFAGCDSSSLGSDAYSTVSAAGSQWLVTRGCYSSRLSCAPTLLLTPPVPPCESLDSILIGHLGTTAGDISEVILSGRRLPHAAFTAVHSIVSAVPSTTEADEVAILARVSDGDTASTAVLVVRAATSTGDDISGALDVVAVRVWRGVSGCGQLSRRDGGVGYAVGCLGPPLVASDGIAAVAAAATGPMAPVVSVLELDAALAVQRVAAVGAVGSATVGSASADVSVCVKGAGKVWGAVATRDAGRGGVAVFAADASGGATASPRDFAGAAGRWTQSDASGSAPRDAVRVVGLVCGAAADGGGVWVALESGAGGGDGATRAAAAPLTHTVVHCNEVALRGVVCVGARAVAPQASMLPAGGRPATPSAAAPATAARGGISSSVGGSARVVALVDLCGSEGSPDGGPAPGSTPAPAAAGAKAVPTVLRGRVGVAWVGASGGIVEYVGASVAPTVAGDDGAITFRRLEDVVAGDPRAAAPAAGSNSWALGRHGWMMAVVDFARDGSDGNESAMATAVAHDDDVALVGTSAEGSEDDSSAGADVGGMPTPATGEDEATTAAGDDSADADAGTGPTDDVAVGDVAWRAATGGLGRAAFALQAPLAAPVVWRVARSDATHVWVAVVGSMITGTYGPVKLTGWAAQLVLARVDVTSGTVVAATDVRTTALWGNRRQLAALVGTNDGGVWVSGSTKHPLVIGSGGSRVAISLPIAASCTFAFRLGATAVSKASRMICGEAGWGVGSDVRPTATAPFGTRGVILALSTRAPSLTIDGVTIEGWAAGDTNATYAVVAGLDATGRLLHHSHLWAANPTSFSSLFVDAIGYHPPSSQARYPYALVVSVPETQKSATFGATLPRFNLTATDRIMVALLDAKLSPRAYVRAVTSALPTSPRSAIAVSIVGTGSEWILCLNATGSVVTEAGPTSSVAGTDTLLLRYPTSLALPTQQRITSTPLDTGLQRCVSDGADGAYLAFMMLASHTRGAVTAGPDAALHQQRAWGVHHIKADGTDAVVTGTPSGPWAEDEVYDIAAIGGCEVVVAGAMSDAAAIQVFGVKALVRVTIPTCSGARDHAAPAAPLAAVRTVGEEVHRVARDPAGGYWVVAAGAAGHTYAPFATPPAGPRLDVLRYGSSHSVTAYAYMMAAAPGRTSDMSGELVADGFGGVWFAGQTDAGVRCPNVATGAWSGTGGVFVVRLDVTGVARGCATVAAGEAAFVRGLAVRPDGRAVFGYQHTAGTFAGKRVVSFGYADDAGTQHRLVSYTTGAAGEVDIRGMAPICDGAAHGADTYHVVLWVNLAAAVDVVNAATSAVLAVSDGVTLMRLSSGFELTAVTQLASSKHAAAFQAALVRDGDAYWVCSGVPGGTPVVTAFGTFANSGVEGLNVYWRVVDGRATLARAYPSGAVYTRERDVACAPDGLGGVWAAMPYSAAHTRGAFAVPNVGGTAPSLVVHLGADGEVDHVWTPPYSGGGAREVVVNDVAALPTGDLVVVAMARDATLTSGTLTAVIGVASTGVMLQFVTGEHGTRGTVGGSCPFVHAALTIPLFHGAATNARRDGMGGWWVVVKNIRWFMPHDIQASYMNELQVSAGIVATRYSAGGTPIVSVSMAVLSFRDPFLVPDGAGGAWLGAYGSIYGGCGLSVDAFLAGPGALSICRIMPNGAASAYMNPIIGLSQNSEFEPSAALHDAAEYLNGGLLLSLHGQVIAGFMNPLNTKLLINNPGGPFGVALVALSPFGEIIRVNVVGRTRTHWFDSFNITYLPTGQYPQWGALARLLPGHAVDLPGIGLVTNSLSVPAYYELRINAFLEITHLRLLVSAGGGATRFALAAAPDGGMWLAASQGGDALTIHATTDSSGGPKIAVHRTSPADAWATTYTPSWFLRASNPDAAVALTDAAVTMTTSGTTLVWLTGTVEGTAVSPEGRALGPVFDGAPGAPHTTRFVGVIDGNGAVRHMASHGVEQVGAGTVEVASGGIAAVDGCSAVVTAYLRPHHSSVPTAVAEIDDGGVRTRLSGAATDALSVVTLLRQPVCDPDARPAATSVPYVADYRRLQPTGTTLAVSKDGARGIWVLMRSTATTIPGVTGTVSGGADQIILARLAHGRETFVAGSAFSGASTTDWTIKADSIGGVWLAAQFTAAVTSLSTCPLTAVRGPNDLVVANFGISAACWLAVRVGSSQANTLASLSTDANPTRVPGRSAVIVVQHTASVYCGAASSPVTATEAGTTMITIETPGVIHGCALQCTTAQTITHDDATAPVLWSLVPRFSAARPYGAFVALLQTTRQALFGPSSRGGLKTEMGGVFIAVINTTDAGFAFDGVYPIAQPGAIAGGPDASSLVADGAGGYWFCGTLSSAVERTLFGLATVGAHGAEYYLRVDEGLSAVAERVYAAPPPAYVIRLRGCDGDGEGGVWGVAGTAPAVSFAPSYTRDGFVVADDSVVTRVGPDGRTLSAISVPLNPNDAYARVVVNVDCTVAVFGSALGKSTFTSGLPNPPGPPALPPFATLTNDAPVVVRLSVWPCDPYQAIERAHHARVPVLPAVLGRMPMSFAHIFRHGNFIFATHVFSATASRARLNIALPPGELIVVVKFDLSGEMVASKALRPSITMYASTLLRVAVASTPDATGGLWVIGLAVAPSMATDLGGGPVYARHWGQRLLSGTRLDANFNVIKSVLLIEESDSGSVGSLAISSRPGGGFIVGWTTSARWVRRDSLILIDRPTGTSTTCFAAFDNDGSLLAHTYLYYTSSSNFYSGPSVESMAESKTYLLMAFGDSSSHRRPDGTTLSGGTIALLVFSETAGVTHTLPLNGNSLVSIAADPHGGVWTTAGSTSSYTISRFTSSLQPVFSHAISQKNANRMKVVSDGAGGAWVSVDGTLNPGHHMAVGGWSTPPDHVNKLFVTLTHYQRDGQIDFHDSVSRQFASRYAMSALNYAPLMLGSGCGITLYADLYSVRLGPSAGLTSGNPLRGNIIMSLTAEHLCRPVDPTPACAQQAMPYVVALPTYISPPGLSAAPMVPLTVPRPFALHFRDVVLAIQSHANGFFVTAYSHNSYVGDMFGYTGSYISRSSAFTVVTIAFSVAMVPQNLMCFVGFSNLGSYHEILGKVFTTVSTNNFIVVLTVPPTVSYVWTSQGSGSNLLYIGGTVPRTAAYTFTTSLLAYVSHQLYPLGPSDVTVHGLMSPFTDNRYIAGLTIWNPTGATFTYTHGTCSATLSGTSVAAVIILFGTTCVSLKTYPSSVAAGGSRIIAIAKSDSVARPLLLAVQGYGAGTVTVDAGHVISGVAARLFTMTNALVTQTSHAICACDLTGDLETNAVMTSVDPVVALAFVSKHTTLTLGPNNVVTPANPLAVGVVNMTINTFTNVADVNYYPCTAGCDGALQAQTYTSFKGSVGLHVHSEVTLNFGATPHVGMGAVHIVENAVSSSLPATLAIGGLESAVCGRMLYGMATDPLPVDGLAVTKPGGYLLMPSSVCQIQNLTGRSPPIPLGPTVRPYSSLIPVTPRDVDMATYVPTTEAYLGGGSRVLSAVHDGVDGWWVVAHVVSSADFLGAPITSDPNALVVARVTADFTSAVLVAATHRWVAPMAGTLAVHADGRGGVWFSGNPGAPPTTPGGAVGGADFLVEHYVYGGALSVRRWIGSAATDTHLSVGVVTGGLVMGGTMGASTTTLGPLCPVAATAAVGFVAVLDASATCAHVRVLAPSTGTASAVLGMAVDRSIDEDDHVIVVGASIDALGAAGLPAGTWVARMTVVGEVRVVRFMLLDAAPTSAAQLVAAAGRGGVWLVTTVGHDVLLDGVDGAVLAAYMNAKSLAVVSAQSVHVAAYTPASLMTFGAGAWVGGHSPTGSHVGVPRVPMDDTPTAVHLSGAGRIDGAVLATAASGVGASLIDAVMVNTRGGVQGDECETFIAAHASAPKALSFDSVAPARSGGFLLRALDQRLYEPRDAPMAFPMAHAPVSYAPIAASDVLSMAGLADGVGYFICIPVTTHTGAMGVAISSHDAEGMYRCNMTVLYAGACRIASMPDGGAWVVVSELDPPPSIPIRVGTVNVSVAATTKALAFRLPRACAVALLPYIEVPFDVEAIGTGYHDELHLLATTGAVGAAIGTASVPPHSAAVVSLATSGALVGAYTVPHVDLAHQMVVSCGSKVVTLVGQLASGATLEFGGDVGTTAVPAGRVVVTEVSMVDYTAVTHVALGVSAAAAGGIAAGVRYGGTAWVCVGTTDGPYTHDGTTHTAPGGHTSTLVLGLRAGALVELVGRVYTVGSGNIHVPMACSDAHGPTKGVWVSATTGAAKVALTYDSVDPDLVYPAFSGASTVLLTPHATAPSALGITGHLRHYGSTALTKASLAISGCKLLLAGVVASAPVVVPGYARATVLFGAEPAVREALPGVPAQAVGTVFNIQRSHCAPDRDPLLDCRASQWRGVCTEDTVRTSVDVGRAAVVPESNMRTSYADIVHGRKFVARVCEVPPVAPAAAPQLPPGSTAVVLPTNAYTIKSSTPTSAEQYCSDAAVVGDLTLVGGAGFVDIYEPAGTLPAAPVARVTRLRSSLAQFGSVLSAEGTTDSFAVSAVGDNTVSPMLALVTDGPATAANTGAVFIYETLPVGTLGGRFVEAHMFKHPFNGRGGRFGAAIWYNGDVLVVGAPSDAWLAKDAMGFITEWRAPIGASTMTAAGSVSVFARGPIRSYPITGQMWYYACVLREPASVMAANRGFGTAVGAAMGPYTNGVGLEVTIAASLNLLHGPIHTYSIVLPPNAAFARLLFRGTLDPPVSATSGSLFGSALDMHYRAASTSYHLLVGAPRDSGCTAPATVDTLATSGCSSRGAVFDYSTTFAPSAGRYHFVPRTIFKPPGPITPGYFGTSIARRDVGSFAFVVIGSPSDKLDGTGVVAPPYASSTAVRGSVHVFKQVFDIASNLYTFTSTEAFTPLSLVDTTGNMGQRVRIGAVHGHDAKALSCGPNARNLMGGVNPSTFIPGSVASGTLYIALIDS